MNNISKTTQSRKTWKFWERNYGKNRSTL